MMSSNFQNFFKHSVNIELLQISAIFSLINKKETDEQVFENCIINGEITMISRVICVLNV